MATILEVHRGARIKEGSPELFISFNHGDESVEIVATTEEAVTELDAMFPQAQLMSLWRTSKQPLPSSGDAVKPLLVLGANLGLELTLPGVDAHEALAGLRAIFKDASGEIEGLGLGN